MEKRDLLFEIGTEELPAVALPPVAQAFFQQLEETFIKAAIPYNTEQSRLFYTPRRLAVLLRDVPVAQADVIVNRQGPALAIAKTPDGSPSKAALGFAKSCGVEYSALSESATHLVYQGLQPGRASVDLLPELLQRVIQQLPLPKSMRWSDKPYSFMRPVHWMLFLFGQEIVPMELLGVQSDNKTYGHRFHCPEAIVVECPTDYEKQLHDAFVIVDPKARAERITQGARSLAKTVQGTPILPAMLCDEIVCITEWPVPLCGAFDADFLSVPKESIISALQSHQKCFALEDKKGALLPYFITISNIESRDAAQVIAGNERVVRARLSDAVFFFEQDKQQALAERIPALQSVIYQKKLGTLWDKIERMAYLASPIAKALNGNQAAVHRAVQLCKTDLLTDMVGEFPTLQGIMGYYYALHDGESEDVAEAIKAHYLPQSADGVLPSNLTGVCVALADRIDHLVSIFSIGKAPTGDKDPFALRRAALGILRLLVEGGYALNLYELLTLAVAHCFGNQANETLLQQLWTFFVERQKAWYLDKGVKADTFAAVLARAPQQPLDFQRRLDAVERFRLLPEAKALGAANKRVRNLLAKQKQTVVLDGYVESLLQESAEKQLASCFETQKAQVLPFMEKQAYEAMLTSLASLQGPLDDFFEQVMVMCEDETLRKNRMGLLACVYHLFLNVADISLLQG